MTSVSLGLNFVYFVRFEWGDEPIAQVLPVNSFEQLLINLANERLQGQFNLEVIEREQVLLAHDISAIITHDLGDYYIGGVPRRADRVGGGGGRRHPAVRRAHRRDPAGARSHSIIAEIICEIISESIALPSQATDDAGRMDGKASADAAAEVDTKLLNELHARFGPKGASGGNGRYVIPRFGSSETFAISHYAGEVVYSVDG